MMGLHFSSWQRDSVASTPGEVTRILLDFRKGNFEAQDRLVPLVYRELRRIAGNHLRHERAHHSLQPTALVHEAYMRLIDIHDINWQSRAHFFSVSSTLMRRILVDHARANLAGKRGEGWNPVSLNDAILPSPDRAPEILALDLALLELAKLDERQAKVVEMRYFVGMNEEEIGVSLGISARTVKRDFRIAKAFLYNQLIHS